MYVDPIAIRESETFNFHWRDLIRLALERSDAYESRKRQGNRSEADVHPIVALIRLANIGRTK